MTTIRPGNQRGHFDHGWLDTYHSFSFGEYHDRDHMGYSCLRVLNEDRISPGQGFGTHPHRDMEIITYVMAGALEHRDSMGNTETIRAGQLQYMGAGTGVTHSEYNPSDTEAVHLIQVWIIPSERGLDPAYSQVAAVDEKEPGRFTLVACGRDKAAPITVRQDARLLLARIDADNPATYESDPARHLWLQVTRGTLALGEHTLTAGDGAAITEETRISLTASSPAEALLFDMP